MKQTVLAIALLLSNISAIRLRQDAAQTIQEETAAEDNQEGFVASKIQEQVGQEQAKDKLVSSNPQDLALTGMDMFENYPDEYEGELDSYFLQIASSLHESDPEHYIIGSENLNENIELAKTIAERMPQEVGSEGDDFENVLLQVASEI